MLYVSVLLYIWLYFQWHCWMLNILSFSHYASILLLQILSSLTMKIQTVKHMVFLGFFFLVSWQLWDYNHESVDIVNMWSWETFSCHLVHALLLSYPRLNELSSPWLVYFSLVQHFISKARESSNPVVNWGFFKLSVIIARLNGPGHCSSPSKKISETHFFFFFFVFFKSAYRSREKGG